MIRLALPTEPAWHDLGDGVRVRARPLTTAGNVAAESAGAEAARRLHELAELAGLADPYADMNAVTGHIAEARIIALGQFLIEAWDGVGNAEGAAPAPVTPENIAALLRIPAYAKAFYAAVTAPLEALASEGNASAPSPNTISAQGASIATDAAPSTATTAPSVPIPPPPPDPSTAPPPGSPADPASP